MKGSLLSGSCVCIYMYAENWWLARWICDAKFIGCERRLVGYCVVVLGKDNYLQSFSPKLYNKSLPPLKRKCSSLVSMDVLPSSSKAFSVLFLRIYVKVFHNGIHNRGKLLNKEKESCLNILNVGGVREFCRLPRQRGRFHLRLHAKK